DSAEAVCDPTSFGLDVLDGLTSLVDKSLILRSDGSGEVRFAMLETIREFGQLALTESGALDEMLERHGEHFLRLAVEAEPHLVAQDQAEWLDRCDREQGNLREALRWAVETGRIERAQRAAGALWRFWQQRGHIEEGARWFGEILVHPAGQGATAARATALI